MSTMPGVSAWQKASVTGLTAEKAALANIDRTLNPQVTPSLRRERKVKGEQPALTKTTVPDHYYRQNIDERFGFNQSLNFTHAPSVASLEQKFFDARSQPASVAVPSTVASVQPSQITKRNKSIPPHLRASARSNSASVPSHLLKAENLRPGNDNSKPHTKHLEPNTTSFSLNSEVQPVYKSKYARVIDAQAASPLVVMPPHARNQAPQKPLPPPSPSLSEMWDDTTTPVETPRKPVQTTKPMNSGKAAKSAKPGAPFPCSYPDCGVGFKNEGALQKHKYEEHDGYCKRCDLDTENDETLLEHKRFDLRHIACDFCGKDFHSEAGRDRHQLKDHRPESNTKCAYCGQLFRSGASLLSHHLRNQCSDPRGGEAKLRQFRALSALSYDKLLFDAHRAEKASRTSSEMRTTQSEDFTGYGSEAGGVPLLDTENDDLESTASDRTVGGKTERHLLDEDLEDLTIYDNASGLPETWSNRLFPEAKPTPTSAGFTPQTEPLTFDRTMEYRNSITHEFPHMLFDFEFAEFKRDTNGEYECPFESCNLRFHTKERVIDHTKGYHLGTELKCPRCLKRFDMDKNELRLCRFPKLDARGNRIVPVLDETAHSFKYVPAIVRLVAHMENSSCGVMENERYGHFIHMISGGFLRVMRDEMDRPYMIEADMPDPNPAAEEYDHPGGSQW